MIKLSHRRECSRHNRIETKTTQWGHSFTQTRLRKEPSFVTSKSAHESTDYQTLRRLWLALACKSEEFCWVLKSSGEFIRVLVVSVLLWQRDLFSLSKNNKINRVKSAQTANVPVMFWDSFCYFRDRHQKDRESISNGRQKRHAVFFFLNED